MTNNNIIHFDSKVTSRVTDSFQIIKLDEQRLAAIKRYHRRIDELASQYQQHRVKSEQSKDGGFYGSSID